MGSESQSRRSRCVDKRAFGRHVRQLRRARGQTQEVLAEDTGLSADTIRRLEHGSFSPSLDTLRKLCEGLDLMLSTLFESFEIGEVDPARELRDMLSKLTGRERRLVRLFVWSIIADKHDFPEG